MLQNLKKALFLGLFAGLLAFGLTAHAATPTIYVGTPNGSLVPLTVTGDINSTVLFFYNVGSSSGMQSRTIGTTNMSGNLSTSVDPGSFGIIPGNSVYVVVNGQQSSMVSWPYSLTLGQTSVSLTSGQSISISISGGGGNYFISSNSNPNIVSASISGASVLLTAIGGSGFSNIMVCSSGGSSCATLTANVNGGSAISFSQTSVTIAPGASQTVTIYGIGGYFISNNTNTTLVSAYLSGNTVIISSPINSTLGSATLTICQQSSGCGTINVTVSGSSGGSQITFSQTNPYLNVGQGASIYVYGGSGSYYLSSNSNSGIVSTTLNGNLLTLNGLISGTATITVCAQSGGCGFLTVNVGGYQTGGTVIFSQNQVSLYPGQAFTVTLSGGSGSYYLSSTNNTGVVNATLSGNSLYLNAVSAGSTTVTVCASGGGCSNLPVTVSGGSNTADINSLIAQLAALKAQLAALQSQPTTPLDYENVTFISFMSRGGSGSEVTALQQRLARLGFFYGPVTGYYGPLTEAAVRSYQTSHALAVTGTTNLATRNSLNSGY